jgi:GNAT superfamily N-acetyltransferase
MFFVEIEGRDPMDSPRLMYRQVSTETGSTGKTTGMSPESKSASTGGRVDKQETHNDMDTPGARLDRIQSPSAYPKVNFDYSQSNEAKSASSDYESDKGSGSYGSNYGSSGMRSNDMSSSATAKNNYGSSSSYEASSGNYGSSSRDSQSYSAKDKSYKDKSYRDKDDSSSSKDYKDDKYSNMPKDYKSENFGSFRDGQNYGSRSSSTTYGASGAEFGDVGSRYGDRSSRGSDMRDRDAGSMTYREEGYGLYDRDAGTRQWDRMERDRRRQDSDSSRFDRDQSWGSSRDYERDRSRFDQDNNRYPQQWGSSRSERSRFGERDRYDPNYNEQRSDSDRYNQERSWNPLDKYSSRASSRWGQRDDSWRGDKESGYGGAMATGGLESSDRRRMTGNRERSSPTSYTGGLDAYRDRDLEYGYRTGREEDPSSSMDRDMGGSQRYQWSRDQDRSMGSYWGQSTRGRDKHMQNRVMEDSGAYSDSGSYSGSFSQPRGADRSEEEYRRFNLEEHDRDGYIDYKNPTGFNTQSSWSRGPGYGRSYGSTFSGGWQGNRSLSTARALDSSGHSTTNMDAMTGKEWLRSVFSMGHQEGSKNEAWDFYRIETPADLQHKGYGHQLVKAAVQHCKKEGIDFSRSSDTFVQTAIRDTKM